ncbi:MAG: hypothetical protein HZB16_05785 [Armatimonadetes bacterium]|nr:hypothetical protein [Armatimonadota bacterium]
MDIDQSAKDELPEWLRNSLRTSARPHIRGRSWLTRLAPGPLVRFGLGAVVLGTVLRPYQATAGSWLVAAGAAALYIAATRLLDADATLRRPAVVASLEGLRQGEVLLPWLRIRAARRHIGTRWLIESDDAALELNEYWSDERAYLSMVRRLIEYHANERGVAGDRSLSRASAGPDRPADSALSLSGDD